MGIDAEGGIHARRAAISVGETAFPLVTIGMPTYNRAGSLRRAVGSALAQDYENLEIVISDNGSTDDTAALCAEIAIRDPRVRVIRQVANRGVTANFVEVLRQARGELFMWLSDDDYLDPAYVSVCVAGLLSQPGRALVAGVAHYERDGATVEVGVPTNLPEPSAVARVLRYLGEVEDNSVFHGICRTAEVSAQPFHHLPGADWLVVASLAAAGIVHTDPTVALHRSMRGASWDQSAVTRLYGLTGRAARNPYGLLLRTIALDMLWRSPAFSRLGRVGRAKLAVRATLVVWRAHYRRVQQQNAALTQARRRTALYERLVALPMLHDILRRARDLHRAMRRAR